MCDGGRRLPEQLYFLLYLPDAAGNPIDTDGVGQRAVTISIFIQGQKPWHLLKNFIERFLKNNFVWLPTNGEDTDELNNLHFLFSFPLWEPRRCVMGGSRKLIG